MTQANRICSCLIAIALCCAAQSPATSEQSKRSEQKSSATSPAEPNESAGEKIRLVGTPFSSKKIVVRGDGPRERSMAESVHLFEIEEHGDSVTFKRGTPFGKRVWTRKLTELSGKERELLDAYREWKSEDSATAPAPRQPQAAHPQQPSAKKTPPAATPAKQQPRK